VTLLLILGEDGLVHLMIEDMQHLLCDVIQAVEPAQSEYPTCIECTRKSWTLEKRFPVKYVWE